MPRAFYLEAGPCRLLPPGQDSWNRESCRYWGETSGAGVMSDRNRVVVMVVFGLLLSATVVLYLELVRSRARAERVRTRYSEAISSIATIQDSLNAIAVGDSLPELR